jgi:hypothetical protein
VFWRRAILSGVGLSAKNRLQNKSVNARINQCETLPKILWVILAVFAFVNGLEALRYCCRTCRFPRRSTTPCTAHTAFAARFGWRDRVDDRSAAVSPSLPGEQLESPSPVGMDLLGGSRRMRRPVGCCLGILTLGAAWIVATGLAIWFILRGDAIQHRRWMIRSYALTAAAITLRIYLHLVFVFHWLLRSVIPPLRGCAGYRT